MNTNHGVKYKGYILHCDPMPMADGRFGAQVTIALHTGDAVVERKFPSLDYLATEEEAVTHAKQWGKAWVDDNS